MGTRRPAKLVPAAVGARRTELVRIALLGIACLVIALVYAHLAAGTYQDDDVDRYFMARQVWNDPSLLLDRWGMPLAVTLFAVPARLFGYAGVETASALFTAGGAVLVALAALGLGLRRAWLAGLLFFFQPMVLNLSYSGLAEPLGALLIAGTLNAWYHRRPGHAVLWAAMLPLARIEAGALTLVVLAAAWRRVGWRARVGAVVPVALWNLAGFAMTGEPLYIFSLGGERPLLSLGVLHYLRNEILVAGPVVLFFLLWALAARADGESVSGDPPGDRQPAEEREPRPGFPLLAAAIFGVHFLVLTLLAWDALPFGRSIGFLRHLVTSAPALALVAAWGLAGWATPARKRRTARLVVAVGWPVLVAVLLSHRLEADSFLGEGRVEWRWIVTAVLSIAGLALIFLRRPARRLRTGAALLGGAGALAVALAVVRPIGLDPERQAIQRAVEEIHNLGFGDAVTYANHPWFTFLDGRDRYDTSRTPHLTRGALETARPGSVVLWENHYGNRLWGDVPEGALDDDPRFMPLLKLTAGRDQNFRVAVYLRGR